MNSFVELNEQSLVAPDGYELYRSRGSSQTRELSPARINIARSPSDGWVATFGAKVERKRLADESGRRQRDLDRSKLI
jgi:hypothetical protein